MQLKNKLGFMLTETLIVTTFVSAILLYMFIQFKVVYRSYNHTFTYDTVNGLYLTNQLRQYINDGDLIGMIDKLDNSTELYLDISDCSNEYFKEVNYCTSLFETLNVEKVLFTRENITSLKNSLSQGYDVDADLVEFIKVIDYNENTDGYRLIVEFKDNTYATLVTK